VSFFWLRRPYVENEGNIVHKSFFEYYSWFQGPVLKYFFAAVIILY